MRSIQVVRFVMFAAVLGTLSGGVGYAQQSAPVKASASGETLVAARDKTTDDQHTAAPPADERQKKLAADTDKLLALATDLKKEVDKTNKDILSIEVVKKADEIEKLARSMKNEK